MSNPNDGQGGYGQGGYGQGDFGQGSQGYGAGGGTPPGGPPPGNAFPPGNDFPPGSAFAQGGRYPQGEPGGYGAMPPAEVPAPVTAADAPPPVQRAVQLMLVQAGLGVIGFIITIATVNTLKRSLRKSNPTWDSSKVNSVAHGALIIAVIIGIVFLVVYVLLALQVRQGKNWARIVTWVLAGLGILSELLSLGGSSATAINKVLVVIGLLINISIVVLLARGGPFFAKRSAV